MVEFKRHQPRLSKYLLGKDEWMGADKSPLLSLIREIQTSDFKKARGYSFKEETIEYDNFFERAEDGAFKKT